MKDRAAWSDQGDGRAVERIAQIAERPALTSQPIGHQQQDRADNQHVDQDRDQGGAFRRCVARPDRPLFEDDGDRGQDEQDRQDQPVQRLTHPVARQETAPPRFMFPPQKRASNRQRRQTGRQGRDEELVEPSSVVEPHQRGRRIETEAKRQRGKHVRDPVEQR